MTSKRDLRAMVERLTAQLELAQIEHDAFQHQVDHLGVTLTRVTTDRDALHKRVIELSLRVQELSGALEQQPARGSVLTINSQPGRFPDVRSLSTPDEAA